MIFQKIWRYKKKIWDVSKIMGYWRSVEKKKKKQTNKTNMSRKKGLLKFDVLCEDERLTDAEQNF